MSSSVSCQFSCQLDCILHRHVEHLVFLAISCQIFAGFRFIWFESESNSCTYASGKWQCACPTIFCISSRMQLAALVARDLVLQQCQAADIWSAINGLPGTSSALERIEGLLNGFAPLMYSFAAGLFQPSATATLPQDWKRRLHNFYYASNRRNHSREYRCMITRMWHPSGSVDAGHIIPRPKSMVIPTLSSLLIPACKHRISKQDLLTEQVDKLRFKCKCIARLHIIHCMREIAHTGSASAFFAVVFIDECILHCACLKNYDAHVVPDPDFLDTCSPSFQVLACILYSWTPPALCCAQEALTWLGIVDVHDERNGILWCRCFEEVRLFVPMTTIICLGLQNCVRHCDMASSCQ